MVANKEGKYYINYIFMYIFIFRIYLSDTFALHAGYNELAEKNDIIIIYPQARTSVLNPYGCWDWYVYMYVYLYMYSVYTCTYVYKYIHAHAVCKWVYVHVCVPVHVQCIYMYICVQVHTCTCCV